MLTFLLKPQDKSVTSSGDVDVEIKGVNRQGVVDGMIKAEVFYDYSQVSIDVFDGQMRFEQTETG